MMFGTICLLCEPILDSMICGHFDIFCAIGGATIGYTFGGFESTGLGAFIGFFLNEVIDNMLCVVDTT